jgi:hypothetical protein
VLLLALGTCIRAGLLLLVFIWLFWVPLPLLEEIVPVVCELEVLVCLLLDVVVVVVVVCIVVGVVIDVGARGVFEELILLC